MIQQEIIEQQTKQVRVGDIIQLEQIRSWDIGDTILINAPTGSGKSFFVTSYLSTHCRAYNRRILLLSNRNPLKDQNVKMSEQDKDIIATMNYQEIEYKIKKREHKSIPEYDYIVADECHYVFADAAFNRCTDLTLNWLLGRKNCVKIFASATGKLVEKYLTYRNIDVIKYEIEPNYDYNQNFYFYKNDKVLQKFLSELPEDEKVIYFSGAEKAYKTSQEFKNSAFICSDNNKNWNKYSSDEVKKQIIESESFECQILCTTSVLDNGVNIKDVAVRHIIVDYFDLDTVQQCVGRKRILDRNDTVNIYIRNRMKNSLNMTRLKNRNILEPAEYFNNYGQVAFSQKYFKQIYSPIIYQWDSGDGKGNKCFLNGMMYAKHRTDQLIITDMLKNDNGYIEAVLKRFKLQGKEYKTLDEEYDYITLLDKLDEFIGIKMFKEEQKRFKKIILKELFNAPNKNHGSLGLKTINALFSDNKLDYIINSKREKSRKNVNINKSYWIISKK